MKIQTIILATATAATLAFAMPSQDSGGSCCGETVALQTQPPKVVKPVPAKEVKGIQKMTITISGGKYTPSVVSVKKGKPVELTFKGGTNLGCGGTIVFKSLNLRKSVTSGKSVVVKFTPKKAGTITYTCSMDMYDGKIIVK